MPPLRVLQFRHDCQNLGCANLSCNLCKLCQRRRCEVNFASKYLAPCDVVEAKCGAQIYVVVVDSLSGQLVQQGLDDACLQIGLIDGRKFEQEGGRVDALEDCLLLLNKQGQPLLAHGRSGTYTDDKRIIIPMIHGQAILPDLKITDSSEALLTGRAPPFRLVVRAVRRTGEPLPDIVPALSEPFVVATARVKGAAKVEIPHLEDHVSKIECVGVQTQKKLEDIRAASQAANLPDLHLPINCVTKVGQFRELVEMAERSKPLRETLKQVLRLTKGWDVARDHVRRAVDTDLQLRTYSPDGRSDVGLVFKCGAFNAIDINHPVGLLRRKQNPAQANQELVDVIWLPRDITACPDAVRKLLPKASSAWWRDGHPGWAFLPLTTAHVPPYNESGQPSSPTSSFTFTIKTGGVPPAGGAAGSAPAAAPGLAPPASDGLAGFGALGPAFGFLQQPAQQQQQQQQQPGGSPPPALDGGGVPLGNAALADAAGAPFGAMTALGDNSAFAALPGGLALGLGSLQGLGLGAVGPGAGGPSLLDGLVKPDQLGLGGPFNLSPAGPTGGRAPGGAEAGPSTFGANVAGLPALSGLQMGGFPSLDLFGSQSMGSAPGRDSGGPPLGLPKADSVSPFEDPAFQNLMAMVAANSSQQQPAAAAAAAAGASGGGEGGAARAKEAKAKRKAETSLDNWVAMHKSLELDISLPPNLAQLSSLFTSLLAGNEMTPDLLRELLPHQKAQLPLKQQQQGQQQQQQQQEDGLGAAAAPVVATVSTEPAAAVPPQPTPAAQPLIKQEQQEQVAAPGPQSAHAAAPGLIPSSRKESFTFLAAGPAVALAPAPVAQPAQMQAAAAQAAGEVPAPTPAVQQQQPAAPITPMPTSAAEALAGVSLEQLQGMFEAAVRQEISYAQLEAFLRQHNLLPAAQQAQQIGRQQVHQPQQQEVPSQQAQSQQANDTGVAGMQSIEPSK